jgi:hypothetical protein
VCLNNSLQKCIEGASNIDTHIGGDELYRKCYGLLRPFWLKWSLGFDIPLEQTTLRGVDEHVPITGYEHLGPAKECDAIWHFFYKVHGKGLEPTFKARQLQLAVIIDEDDFNHAEEMKNLVNNIGVSDAVTKVSKTLQVCVSLGSL